MCKSCSSLLDEVRDHVFFVNLHALLLPDSTLYTFCLAFSGALLWRVAGGCEYFALHAASLSSRALRSACLTRGDVGVQTT